MDANLTSRFKLKYAVIALAAFAGFLLLRIGTNSERFDAAAQALALLAGLVLFVGAVFALYRDYRSAPGNAPVIRESELAAFLFSSGKSAPLWLGARIYLGYEWFVHGWEKVVNPEWMSGASLSGYWQRAIAIPEQGRPPISYDLYREYIRYMLDNGWAGWFAGVVAWGEVLVGVALILGALTGIAAFFGALMNMSFMLAGSASTNPVLFTLSILIILAWRVAGLIGLDRWLLPALGSPWSPAALLPGRDGSAATGYGGQHPPSVRPA
jgi:thiosulfate dehydrogenase [quinone] large subunit